MSSIVICGSARSSLKRLLFHNSSVMTVVARDAIRVRKTSININVNDARFEEVELHSVGHQQERDINWPRIYTGRIHEVRRWLV